MHRTRCFFLLNVAGYLIYFQILSTNGFTTQLLYIYFYNEYKKTCIRSRQAGSLLKSESLRMKPHDDSFKSVKIWLSPSSAEPSLHLNIHSVDPPLLLPTNVSLIGSTRLIGFHVLSFLSYRFLAESS